MFTYFHIISKNFRAVVTHDLQLQLQARSTILENPNFLAKSIKNKKCNKINLEKAIMLTVGQIIIFNKRNKMTQKLVAPLLHHHFLIKMA